MPNFLLAQQPLRKALSPWRVSVGGTWQGAPNTNFRNVSNIIRTYIPTVCGGGPCIPFNYERNIQGIGLSLGAAVRTKSLFELHYTPILRYDEIHFADLNPQKRYKEIIVNHRFGINKYFGGKEKQPNQYLGVSYMILNTGKQFDFYDSVRKQTATLDLQIPAVTFAYGHAIYKKFYGEFQVYSLYKGLPHNHSRRFFMYGLSVYYNYDFSMKGVFNQL